MMELVEIVQPQQKKISPLLCGNTIGAQLNRLLSNHSLSLLIVSGNYKMNKNMMDVGTGEYACAISTNQIGKLHKVSQQYRVSYEKWMDRAVSDLIQQVDDITYPCVLFPNTDVKEKLFFDMTLGSSTKKKCRIFVHQTMETNNLVTVFELFIDTFIHDKGIWKE